ncbi:helix-turn-helix transcriptional regulator [Thalassospira profundimaris]|uniref:HTH cro/C1-type domain-containing protein n=1 Tax=Thalassospira profundimaris TaxID=502049 RepID=A0A367WPC3_9PROT|nr:helix-turn-helix transcriptional regulator [Thalassospira profundimaris]RCK43228.1 hypothetical protein TH30_19625 [Thalassospira profundimaris]
MQTRQRALRGLSITRIEQLVADQIRRRRIALEMSQEQLARALDPFGIRITRSVIHKYEQGPGKTGAGLSMTMSRALGLVLFQSETGLLDSLQATPEESIPDSTDSAPSTTPESAEPGGKEN